MKALIRGKEVITEPFSPWVQNNLAFLTGTEVDADGNPIKGIARHPIIGDDVVIYSNASILGRITIGNGAVIGGNIWVTEDIAPGEKLIQAKANNILRFKQDI